MKTLDTWGGAAALLCGGTYVFGFALLTTVLASSGYGTEGADPAAIVDFIAANTGLMLVWNSAIYIVNGLALALLAVALGRRFAEAAPGLGAVVQTFGALWATLVTGAGMVANVGVATVAARHAADPGTATLMWEIFSAVENGLGGGNEIAGSAWALVVAAAALRTGLLPRGLAFLGIAIAAGGVLTVVPATGDVPGAVFGLGYIAWFFWAGVALVLRPAAPRRAVAAA